MQTRKWFRGLWSRRTLAAKLTISYTAALLLIAVVVGVLAAFAVVMELRRAGADAAARAAAATALAIEETVDAYHSSFLLTQVEAATRALAQMDPVTGRDSAIAYVDSRNQGTRGFLFLIDQTGRIIYQPPGVNSVVDTDAASQIAADGPGFLRYHGPATSGNAGSSYHACSAAIPRWDWIVVSAEAEEDILRRIPEDVLYRLLESGAPGGIRAAAFFLDTGEAIAASTEWPEWADQALPVISLDAAGVNQVAVSFGEKLRHVAYTQLSSFNATIAVVYIADYLEELLGRFVLMLAGVAVIALIVVAVVSRQTAALVTAPVHRAARRLIGSATKGRRSEPGDELANLVRRLLRTSVM
ncbi:MAG: hypothetical protein KOO61_06975, partial [Spirochaetales bacterium]|nr:hypothetical protein [Spirochaetales bacterium]